MFSRLFPSVLVLVAISISIELAIANDAASEMEIARALNGMKTLDEFFDYFNVPKISSRSNDFDVMQRSSNAIVASPAPCKPELQVVQLKDEFDSIYRYFTKCTRVKRCGGCCSIDRLSCQPTATELINFQLNRVHGVTNVSSIEIVPLEIHKACACKCTITERDCKSKHYYNETECMCTCKNRDEEYKCMAQNDIKFWNVENCSCECKVATDCPTGYYRDQRSCRCLEISRPWFNNYYQSTGFYNVPQTNINQRQKDTPPHIIFFPDASDPRRRHKEDPEY